MSKRTLAAVGSAEANETYLGLRMAYRGANEVETDLSGQVSTNEALSIIFRALLGAVVTLLLFSLPAGIISFVSGAKSISVFGGFDAASLISAAGVVVAFVAPVLAFVVMLIIPKRQLLSEWQVVLDDRSSAADSVFAAIYNKLRDRQMPVAVKGRRLKLTGGEQVNNYLIISDGKASVYVTSFSYGTSLYLGWSMWTRQMPFVMLLRWIFEGSGSGNRSMRAMLRSSSLRALREVVHSVCREGLDVAVAGLDGPIAATFGQDVAVELLDAQHGGSVPSRPSAAPPVPSRPPATAPVPPRPTAAPVHPPLPSAAPSVSRREGS